MQNVTTTDRILGRDSAGAGVIEEITPANLRTMLGVEASSTADQSASEIKTLLEDGIDSVHYVDGSIDSVHIGDDQIDSQHYVDLSIDTAHIGNLQVTAAKVAADVATQAELDTVSVVASAAATTGKAIAMAIVFGG